MATLAMLGCQATEKPYERAGMQMLTEASGYIKPYPIVDTGQVETFDKDGDSIKTKEGQPFYGQDGDYAGLPFQFVDNGDGTISDKNTGLTWLQQPSQDRYSWRNALDYCDNLDFAGHDDWRLPSLKELISIEDFSDGWPYLDRDVFDLGDGEVGKHMQYWSSNYYYAGTTHGGMETAFGLNFGTGHIKGYPAADEMPEGEQPPAPSGGPEGTSMTSVSEKALAQGKNPPAPGMSGSPLKKYAWAVRGREYGKNSFINNGDGTVSDLATGMMWMKQDSAKGLDWENALAYAENLEYAGYDDWKLPNIKELQSIVDYSGVYPAINPTFFETTDKDAYFWTSTSAYFAKVSNERQKKYWAWYVAFGYAVDSEGNDLHGAGATRYDTKYEGGPTGEDAERVYNFARAVRKYK
jgi:hypothetical protein